MTVFILVAALMAALAAAAVAWPLWRHGQGRIPAVLAAVIVVAAAAGLYPLWSNWNWHAPAEANAGPDVAAMVVRLEQRMRSQPNDVRGWLMLGRSYLALQRVDDAAAAYGRAHALDARNVEAVLGLGESLSLKAGGEITTEAGAYFEEALGLAPDNPKALLYGGFAAASRGDRGAARARWRALEDLHPPPEIVQLLDARIAALGPEDGSTRPAGPAGPAGTSASAPGTSTSREGLSGAAVAVNITLASGLKPRVTAEVPLFIFAREPGGHGPPLAAKRLTTSALGSQVRLSSADSMIPGRVLAAGRRVTVTARVSFSGQPGPSRGDLFGELSYEVGSGSVGQLVIDKVAD